MNTKLYKNKHNVKKGEVGRTFFLFMQKMTIRNLFVPRIVRDNVQRLKSMSLEHSGSSTNSPGGSNEHLGLAKKQKLYINFFICFDS